ncbi:MAG: hypothetical protein ABWX67_03880 [Allosphingosinicella sp.]
MSLYRAYGLDLECERPLPLRLAPSGNRPDLTIVHSGPAPAGRPSGPDRRDLKISESGWTLRYDNREGGWMAFDYSAAERRLQLSGSVAWEAFEGPLGGVVIGVLLGLEGATLLHGACLGFGERAIAILGASGHGKSTLAGALIALGAAPVTEDLLLLRRGRDAFEAEPGAPTLHLLADAWRHLAPHLPEASARPGGDGKVRLELGGDSSPARLAALYVLEPPGSGGESALERLAGPAAVGALAEHLYGSRWIRPAGDEDLAFCARLALEVPVFALSRPWALEGVLATAEAVRGHALES